MFACNLPGCQPGPSIGGAITPSLEAMLGILICCCSMGFRDGFILGGASVSAMEVPDVVGISPRSHLSISQHRAAQTSIKPDRTVIEYGRCHPAHDILTTNSRHCTTQWSDTTTPHDKLTTQ
eukprot:scaffold12639_cov68-Cyclotella_meneghiniana.AAC.1